MKFTGDSPVTGFNENSADKAFNPNDYISGPDTTVTVSRSAIGVAGNTIGKDEVMNLDFYTTSDPSQMTAAKLARAEGVYIKFDGIGTADVVVVLKLIDEVTDSTITRMLIVRNEDFYKNSAPSGYSDIVLGSNDGLMIIEKGDYNLSGERYAIVGMQVMTSSNGLTATNTAYDFNGLINSGNLSTNNLMSLEPIDLDGDVLKVLDMGFMVKAPLPTVDLNFNVKVIDADGDSTNVSSLAVSVIGEQPLLGTSSDDAIYGSYAKDSLIGGAGSDTMYGGSGADKFVWNLGDAYHATGNDFQDVVMDFSRTEGDIIDLTKLLVGEHATTVSSAGGWTANLDAFLSFAKSGANTILTIDTVGSSSSGDHQTVKFENTDLFQQFSVAVTGNAATDSHNLIMAMYNDGKLLIDS